jgi:hypothetical protein
MIDSKKHNNRAVKHSNARGWGVGLAMAVVLIVAVLTWAPGFNATKTSGGPIDTPSPSSTTGAAPRTEPTAPR